jgi:hypothetical protein
MNEDDGLPATQCFIMNKVRPNGGDAHSLI